MRIIETQITIEAPTHTVWSVLDDVDLYPEWNPALPLLSGLTTVGQVVRGVLRQPNAADREVAPTITRVVGGRELRWLTVAPNSVFTAEHVFILNPTPDGHTNVTHNEIFGGSALEDRWSSLNTNLRAAYLQMNNSLKARAEALVGAQVSLHPAIGRATSAKSKSWAGSCRCGNEPVQFEVSEALAHNHLCGCSKCWKPEGAVFAQIAVVPAGEVAVTSNAQKVEAVDATQKIIRHRCRNCGTHIVGKVIDQEHHFFGLDFVHPELGVGLAQPKIEFAGFVSSIVETGVPATRMQSVRRALAAANIPAYDSFSPELMDLIAWHKVKLSRFTKEP